MNGLESLWKKWLWPTLRNYPAFAWADRAEPRKSLGRTLTGHPLHSSKKHDCLNWLIQCMNFNGKM